MPEGQRGDLDTLPSTRTKSTLATGTRWQIIYLLQLGGSNGLDKQLRDPIPYLDLKNLGARIE